MDFEQIDFTIEEDLSGGLFKIKSTKNYTKDKGKNICRGFKNLNISCILSQV